VPLLLDWLQGEVKEDVYVAQMRLQEELEELFAAIDKAKGQATGFIPKARQRGCAHDVCVGVVAGGRVCGWGWGGPCSWGWRVLKPGGQR
jgi:hypothetical protein